LGVAERALEPLREAGIPYRVFDQVPPDSSLDVVGEVAEMYQGQGCDGFVAIGGGSVIDTVKGAAASISTGGEDFARLQGSEILHEELPPFIAIPTTAGTGSEVTLVAVVADTQAHAKLSYTSYRLVPHCALLDPTLTTSLPPKLTATTAVDALTHAIEAYTSIQKNPVSDALACGAIDLISRNLDEACTNPENRDARTNLALGSCMAGAAFSNAMVGLVHAIGHSLGGLAHVPHGLAMTILLPHCVHFNNQNGYHAGLYGQMLPYLDPTAPVFQDPIEADRAFEAALFQMNSRLHDAYGVPILLAEANVGHDSLPAVARQARYDGAALYNRQEITEEAALEILEASYR
jgi:alcohol dehydrogenase